jgi:hypothetical protein
MARKASSKPESNNPAATIGGTYGFEPIVIRNSFASLSRLRPHTLRCVDGLAILGSSFDPSLRPYQVKNMATCIPDDCGNGCNWSITSSGKALTCFEVSLRVRGKSDFVNCLFGGERKDLIARRAALVSASESDIPGHPPA